MFDHVSAGEPQGGDISRPGGDLGDSFELGGAAGAVAAAAGDGGAPASPSAAPSAARAAAAACAADEDAWLYETATRCLSRTVDVLARFYNGGRGRKGGKRRRAAHAASEARRRSSLACSTCSPRSCAGSTRRSPPSASPPLAGSRARWDLCWASEGGTRCRGRWPRPRPTRRPDLPRSSRRAGSLPLASTLRPALQCFFFFFFNVKTVAGAEAADARRGPRRSQARLRPRRRRGAVAAGRRHPRRAAGGPVPRRPCGCGARERLLDALEGVAGRAAAADGDRSLRTSLAGAQEADGVSLARRLPTRRCWRWKTTPAPPCSRCCRPPEEAETAARFGRRRSGSAAAPGRVARARGRRARRRRGPLLLLLLLLLLGKHRRRSQGRGRRPRPARRRGPLGRQAGPAARARREAREGLCSRA